MGQVRVAICSTYRTDLLGRAFQPLPPTAAKSGAGGEIRTLKDLFLRQAAIPIRARLTNLTHR
jgi:hypothetical protein